MEVEIISRQCIKPSSPTPIHLRTHNLSIIDKFMPSVYIPMALFYTADDESTESIIHTQQKLKQLKESLSQVLTQFYPFAGRIRDNFTIDCNEEGVQYNEAKVSCSLVEFFNQSNFSLFVQKFVPNQPIWEASTEGYTTMIQVTCFACGGIVIGTLISHMIADGASASFFLNSWASSSRREFQHAFALPNFDSPFPRGNLCPQDANSMVFCGQILKGRPALRRFLFDAKAISKLKAQASSLTVQNPTRVEVVTSLLWKCAAKAFSANSSLESHTLVTHAVNMRGRASPSFPNSFMGNFVWIVTALLSAEEKVIELPDLVIKLREAVTAINSEFVKGFQGEGGLVKYGEILKQLIKTAPSATFTNAVNYFHYTSWCNFGLYKVDFGWGKPIWASSIIIPSLDDAAFFNMVLLMDTPDGKGIEVWIYLKENDMAMLLQDKELLTFATLDPNPMHPKDYIFEA
ncbi:hypothetical protein VNO77_16081 [Canavalia gladiata]|uniref:Uncharacterized protein n=1 Tax=Canavalia gladiata TaxID=3824 RepID=A0AAN9M0E2_CANGL